MEVAAAADIVSIHLALNAQTRGFIGAAFLRRHAAGRVLHQHLARRSGGSGGAGARGARKKIRAGLDVFAKEPAAGAGEFTDEIARLRPGLRHAPHRRIHRAGAGGDCRRDGAHHPNIPGDRPGAQRGQPGPKYARHLRAGGAAPGPAGRAGQRARRHQRRAASTCRKWKTWSSKAPKPRWRGFTWRPNLLPPCWSRRNQRRRAGDQSDPATLA